MIKSDELNENLLNKNPKLNFVINVKFDQQKILQKLKSNTLIFAKIQELSITDSELLKYMPQILNWEKEQRSAIDAIYETIILREQNKIKFYKKMRNNHQTNEFKIENNILFKNISSPIHKELLRDSKLNLSNETSDIMEYLNEFKNDPFKVNSLFLSGNIYSKRSYILSIIANEYAILNKKVAYLDINLLEDKIYRNINKKEIDLDDLIEELSSIDILIFDEIGVKSLSNWFIESIFVPILSNRYKNVELKTFFGSYYIFNALQKQLFKNNYNDKNKTNYLYPISEKMIYLIDKISKEKVWINDDEK
ncbi:hypothetical protein [Mycoplasmopsis cynos]|uniref:Primosomal protein DnaI n=3 Tax=Mycoplasmopsis cynos TaxID=171284 RepID=A0ABD8AIM7_9BACT|nr:hypothetical protein [Mycoplasmopsis cynos]MCU9935488.1 hypothetical protein [Mycoplasmopsis cynos]UWV80305.1 hypothetical protein NW069_02990 [Mycoplasmopsis cynos]UWV85762.1 hypothetical protein NW063_02595 [Mycoplasmopsis cynos]UWV92211.1 hypothetical protein NWE57_04855 [Mycoplasmopsis cynos]WAM05785.1 hypothetical protein OM999_00690 [Mycoplasmopsis cynos]